MASTRVVRRTFETLAWLVLIKGGRATSSQKQVILTFEYVNGTLVPVVHNATDTTSNVKAGPLVAAIFLVSPH